MDIFTVLSLIGGLALFLYGMDLMGDSLKKLAGGKLESILARLTSSKWKGFLLGFVVTAVIQSSSATTVMLVGFVNSGIMKLGQTISIILGANIGTTVTAWLLSTADIQGTAVLIKLFKPESFTPILAAAGLIMTMVAKDDRKRNTGTILIGFAVLMFGMDAMSDAVKGLRDEPAFTSVLTMFSNNPIMGILVGTIFTAIIQSSSASVGVLQALALTCFIPYSTAIPVILGQNIGTTITPIISSISGNTESKRVAISCLLIKMLGVVLVGVIFYALNAFVGFEFMSQAAGATGIALVHTLFNVFATVLLMPATSLVEKIAVEVIKSKEKEPEADMFSALDDRFLAMPGFAVEKSKELLLDMANISRASFVKSAGLLDHYDSAVFDEVNRLEDLVDKYEDRISTYLVRIAKTQTSSKDSKLVTELLHTIGDIERISDYALNIAEAAKEVNDKGISFSDKALQDISVINKAVTEVLDLTIDALIHEDVEKAKMVEPLEQVVDNLNRKIKNGHIQRLQQGDCTMELGFILADMMTGYERISDHCSNIAVCIIEIANDSFQTHEYLNHLKSGDEGDFSRMYQEYKEKYRLN